MSLASLFGDIADAIREQNGTQAPITAGAFPEAIRALPGTSTGTGGTYAGASGLRELFADIAGAIREKEGAGDTSAATGFPARIRALTFYETKTETFTESAIWTVPAGVADLSVVCIGGGGGGGGNGGKGGLNSPTRAGGYGYGGSKGELTEGTFPVTAGEEIAVIVGRGGSAGSTGASVRVTGANGTVEYQGKTGGAGRAGGASCFGNRLTAAGGAGGAGGGGGSKAGAGKPTSVQQGEEGHSQYDNAGCGGKSAAAGGDGIVVVTYKAPVAETVQKE